MGVGLISLAFMIPIWAKPDECFDPITANDMYTNMACAWSGAIVLFGGLAAVMWIFNRSLSLHLQICWQRTMGKKFFYCTHVLAWGLTALLGGISLGLSGVSYRFGKVCHINHENSLAAFWGPVLGFAALAAMLQFITLGYCMKVYLRHLWDPDTTSGPSSSIPSVLPSMTGSSIKTKSAKATYRRVRKVIGLQWRGVLVVMILLFSAIYFAVIFQVFDSLSQRSIEDPTRTEGWVACLIVNGGNKEPCLGLASELSLREPVVLAVLYLLSLMGYWCLLFLGRPSMFSAWWAFIKRPFGPHDHFVSYDARRISDPRNYEMLTSPPQSYHITKRPQGGLVATAKPASYQDVRASDAFVLDPAQLKDFAENYGNDESPIDDIPEEPPQQQQQQQQQQILPQPAGRWNTNTAMASFSQPCPPARSHSQQSHVTFSPEGPTEIPSTTATPTRISHGGWPSTVTRPAPVLTSASRETPNTTVPSVHHPSQDKQPRNPSASSYSSTTHLRSESALSNIGRSGPALGRELVGSGHAPLMTTATTPPPVAGSRGFPGPPTGKYAYRSNSRMGLGALAGTAGREWDEQGSFTRY
ncbi:MAG: hypothetical protein LQ340_006692 [Diploschistes diacapsis]|nr:MAG: hypothetical protein LQ340_006692 [Diploschistes diacapsis]